MALADFRFRIVALHSTLSSKDQAAAFTVPPAGVKKVLLLDVALLDMEILEK